MAERAFVSKQSSPSGKWLFGQITGTATANKLVDADTTEKLYITGVKKIYARGTYVKGSSTNGKIEILVDGVVQDSSSTSTTDGEILSCDVVCPITAEVWIKATITGTATGASVNYATLTLTEPAY